jgi:2-dehydro-3-deoxy-D-arabinonate dehydratase
MRRVIRWADADERVTVGVELDERGRFHAVRGTDDPLEVLGDPSPDLDEAVIVALDADTLALGDGLSLLRPLDPPEVWCAGVTYERSRDARMEESTIRDVYADVYTAARPELFLKDAACRRTVGPDAPIGIRGDSIWNVPEPEIGLVLGQRGAIVGYTIGNDVSSREIEGANPLYLSQAKVYAGACAIGPALYRPDHTPHGFQIHVRITDEHGEALYEDRTTTAQMTRSFEQLVSWLVRDNPIAPGTVLLTGTGLVPPDEVSLVPGHRVEIHVPEIGALVNPVALASTLV